MSTIVLAIENPLLRELCRQELLVKGYTAVILERPLALLELPLTLVYDAVCVDASPLGDLTLQILGENQVRLLAVGVGLDCPLLAASLPLPLDAERFVATIDRLLGGRGEPAAPPPHIELDPARRLARAGGREVTLTRIEFRLLTLLYEQRPRDVGLLDVLQGVWGFTEGRGTSELVRTHIRNLRLKLDQIGLPDAVRSRRGRGYALVL